MMLETIGTIGLLVIAGLVALYGLARIGAGMMDPQGSQEAARYSGIGCLIVLASLAFSVWVVAEVLS